MLSYVMNQINRQRQKIEQQKEQQKIVNGVKVDKLFKTVEAIKKKPEIAKFNSKKFLDVHSLKGFDEETLRKLQQSSVDEFGITHLNILYNKEEDKFFCLLEAPNREAVENHHHKAGVKCEWITEVKTTA